MQKGEEILEIIKGLMLDYALFESGNNCPICDEDYPVLRPIFLNPTPSWLEVKCEHCGATFRVLIEDVPTQDWWFKL
jgi:transposase-like protein